MVTLAPETKGELAPKRRVEILGVFGSGKTTLARRLAGGDRLLLPEDHERNPFWGNERVNHALGYLAYDLSFLLQHAHLVAGAASGGLLVCDWSLASDRLWASMRLGVEFAAYEAVHSVINSRVGEPEGYLYLRQPVDEIVARLERRGRIPESAFRAHVSAAADRLEEFVGALASRKVLTVDDAVEIGEVSAWLQESKKGQAND